MLFGCAKEKVIALDCEEAGKYLLYPEKGYVIWVDSMTVDKYEIYRFDYELQTYPEAYIFIDGDKKEILDRSSLVLKYKKVGEGAYSAQCYLDQPKI